MANNGCRGETAQGIQPSKGEQHIRAQVPTFSFLAPVPQRRFAVQCCTQELFLKAILFKVQQFQQQDKSAVLHAETLGRAEGWFHTEATTGHKELILKLKQTVTPLQPPILKQSCAKMSYISSRKKAEHRALPAS